MRLQRTSCIFQHIAGCFFQQHFAAQIIDIMARGMLRTFCNL